MSRPALNLDDLSPEDKLRLLEDGWDSLAANPRVGPVADWHVRELDRRLDELDQDGVNGIPWERVLRGNEGQSPRTGSSLLLRVYGETVVVMACMQVKRRPTSWSGRRQ